MESIFDQLKKEYETATDKRKNEIAKWLYEIIYKPIDTTYSPGKTEAKSGG